MRVTRKCTIAVTVLGSLVLVGCSAGSAGYDSVLWLQMDAAENVLFDELVSLHQTGSTQADTVAAVKAAGEYWDGTSDPSFLTPDAPAAVIIDFRPAAHEFPYDSALSFDALIFSGPRDPDLPRKMPGSSAGGRYDGPPALYTCFTIEVAFTDDRMSNWHRSFDNDSRIPCPEALVAAMGEDAQYQPPTEFDG